MFKTKINVTNTRECLFKYQNESADGQISLKKKLTGIFINVNKNKVQALFIQQKI